MANHKKPRYRKRKYAAKKKAAGLKRTRRTRKSRVPMAIMGNQFPRKVKLTLPYVENQSLIGTATPYEYMFRGNGIYDPNLTGTGHQPMGFDQWAAIYDNYYVAGSKITVTVANTSGSGSNYEMVYLRTIRANAAITPTLTNNAALMELDNCKWARVGVLNSGHGNKTIRQYRSTKSRLIGNYDRLSASATTGVNPAQEWYWHIIVTSLDDITALSSVMTVRIKYYVELFNPKVFAQS